MKILNGASALLMAVSGTAMACDFVTPPGGGVNSVPEDPARSQIMSSLGGAQSAAQGVVRARGATSASGGVGSSAVRLAPQPQSQGLMSMNCPPGTVALSVPGYGIWLQGEFSQGVLEAFRYDMNQRIEEYLQRLREQTEACDSEMAACAATNSDVFTRTSSACGATTASISQGGMTLSLTVPANPHQRQLCVSAAESVAGSGLYQCDVARTICKARVKTRPW